MLFMHEPNSKCYIYALHYLSRYPKTEKELSIKLMQKWYSSHDIERAIEFLKTKEYVNDRKFAEMYFQSEAVRKWKPLISVKNKLFQKWIEKGILNEVIEEMASEIKEWILEKIQKEITKMKVKGIDGFDIIQKLMRRGYHLDDIKNVLNK